VWQQAVKPPIDQVQAWQRQVQPVLTEPVAQQHVSKLLLKSLYLQRLKSSCTGCVAALAEMVARITQQQLFFELA
jgi:hypothetical protein